MDVPVTLIVKAPNQQFEDQTIKCELSWTIRKLKGYLSEVYPCKPGTDEQKLIYSGQLLPDTVVLKDILRQYEESKEGQQVHTVHLVFTPKNKQPSPLTTKKFNTNTDGLRHRTNIASSSSSSSTAAVINTAAQSQQPQNQQQTINLPPSFQQQQQMFLNNLQNIPTMASGGVAPNFMNVPQLNASTSYAAQQLAMHNWMQNAYAQYFTQYMNLMQMGIRPETVFMPQATVNQSAAPVTQLPFSPFYPQNFNTPVIATHPLLATPPVSVGTPHIPTPQSTNQTPPQVQPLVAGDQAPPNEQVGGDGVDGGVAQAGVAGQGAVGEAENRPQPRFPNIMVEEPPENRDWLDMFYTMSRLIIFMTLVYFYSSPVRCFVVLLIAIVGYLYHIGFFRPTLPEANNNQRPPIQQNNNVVAEENNNVANERVAPAAVAGDNQNEEQQQQPDNNAGDGVVPPPPQPHQPATAEPNSGGVEETTEQRSIISFIRTFVVTFFTSLIPETPAL